MAARLAIRHVAGRGGVAAVVVVAGIAVGAFTLINSQSNTVGNTSANLANIGISAKQGDWIYYITVDSAKSSSNGPTGISKMHTDGSGVIKVTSEIGYYLNVKGDWIYYVGFNRDSSNGNSSGPSGIYKMRTDGTNKITLTSDTAMDINVIGDWIYYVGYTDLNNSGSGAIYKIRTDGTNKSKLDGSSNLSSSGGGYSNLSLNVVGDWIYYVGNVDDSNSDSNNVAIYKIHTDGSNQTKLDSGLAASINVIGDWIYYVSTSDGTSSSLNGAAIYKIHTDGSGKTKIVDKSNIYISSGGSINVVGDWMYYVGYVDNSTSSSDVAIYKIHTDGSGKTKLDSVVAMNVNIFGDWIYYIGYPAGSSISDNQSVYRIHTDGTQNQQLK